MATFTDNTKNTATFADGSKNSATFSVLNRNPRITYAEIPMSLLDDITFQDAVIADGTILADVTFDDYVSSTVLNRYVATLWAYQTKN